MIAVVVQKDYFLEGQRHIIVLLSDLIFSLFFADPLWKKSQGKKRLALICFLGVEEHGHFCVVPKYDLGPSSVRYLQ